jgi:hypothetical protein
MRKSLMTGLSTPPPKTDDFIALMFATEVSVVIAPQTRR